MHIIKEDVPPEKQIQEWMKDMPSVDINNLPEDWDYYWESTLEEDLIEDSYVYRCLVESGEINESVSDREKIYQPWDIVMFNIHDGNPGVAKHRIVIIDSLLGENDAVKYGGFVLSSKIEKANKNSKKFPNNLYISDYSTILETPDNNNKPGIIKIDEVHYFTNENLSDHGSWKGHANKEFQQFVRDAYNNYRSGRSDLNASLYWEK